jgi:hypothetical protein
MEIERIREANHARPFRPFKFVLSDGRRLEVYDDCCLAIAPTGRQVALFVRKGPLTFLSPDEIDSLDFSAPSSSEPASPAA